MLQKKQKNNPGWFKRGPDERRRLWTPGELRRIARLGYAAAVRRHPELEMWLLLRAHSYARARRRRERRAE